MMIICEDGLRGLDLLLAGLYDLGHAPVKLRVVYRVVFEVHEREEAEALLRVPVQHQLDHVLRHLRHGHIRWESQPCFADLLFGLLLG